MKALGGNDTIEAGVNIAFTVAGHCGIFNFASGPSLSDLQGAMASVDGDITILSVIERSHTVNLNSPGTQVDVHCTVTATKPVGLFLADVTNMLSALNSGAFLTSLGACNELQVVNNQVWLDDSVISTTPPAAPTANILDKLFGDGTSGSAAITWPTAIAIVGIGVIGIVFLVGTKEVEGIL